jgi:hypothetical protein
VIAVINGITRHAKELEMKLTICYQITNTFGIVFVVHYPITQMVYLSHRSLGKISEFVMSLVSHDSVPTMISGLTWWITWCRSGTLDFTD